MAEKICQESAITFERHPPERRRSKTVTTHCGCCCCCCCCLHSLGALLGAASGSAPVPGSGEEIFVRDEQDPSVYRRVMIEGVGSPGKVVSTFWLTFAVVTLVASVVGVGERRAPEPPLALVFIATPFLLVVSLIVTAFVTLITYGGPAEWRQLGRIALGGFIGFTVGYALMWGLCSGMLFPFWPF